MSKGSVSNFTTTSSLPGAPMESHEGGETTATRFGNFEVLLNDEGALHLLGGGGFGKTYKARHVYLNQIVALKVINDRFLHDNSAKERFLREAQVVHQLRHEHIAHVIDFGEVKSALYYAMEFCGGGNLENMVSRIGPLPLPIMVRCARQLAEALGCAHSHGFIHRDVKPANIMLTGTDDTRPELKLVDFGLVKHLQSGGAGEATAALTMTGQQFFTIQFASPEQLMEEELDARSDLFALGMTLWFLVKGAPPETGSMASIVAKRLDSKSYEALLPAELPPAYRSLLGRLLEKDRGLRFQSTDEFLAALDTAEAAPDAVLGVATAKEEESAADSGAEAELESADAGPASITDRYDVQENLGSMPLGVLYRATRKGDNEQVAITMVSDDLRDDPAQRTLIASNVARLQTQPHETIARVHGLEECQEGLALVQEWHQGVSLHSILKTARFLSYSEALRVLLPIAQGTDWTIEQGLPGIVLAMDEIYLQPLDAGAYPEPEKLLETPLKNWPPFRVRLLPYVIREEVSQDVSRTFNTEIVADPTVAFGCLLYHLIAGHAPRGAAKLAKSAYVTIGRLAEDSNRLLASCIVNERDFGGCEGVLRTLNGSEGVSFASATARSNVAEAKADPPKTRGGGPIDLTRGRTPTSGKLDLTRTGAKTSGLGGSSAADSKVDTRSKGLVIETKPLTKTGGVGGTGGTTLGRTARDLARQVEEARIAKQAREAEEGQLKQQTEEARLRKETDEAQRRQELAQEARLRKEADDAQRRQQAEEARLKKEADEAQRRQLVEEARLKKQADDEQRKQQAEEARLKKLADKQADEALRKQQAEEARLKKQQAEQARIEKQAEEKRLKQQQVEAARAKQLELHEQQQAAALEAKAAGQQLSTAEATPRQSASGLSPVVLAAIGAGALLLVGAGAYFVLHKTPPPVVADQTPAPTPSPTVVATPNPSSSVAPAQTPAVTAPVRPKEFAFLQGFKPANALVKLGGQTLKLSAQGGKVIAPLPVTGGDSVTVEAPGYDSRTFPITGDATERSQVVLRRQEGQIKFALEGGSSDYATAVFKAISGLNGEQAYVSMSPDERAVNIANGGSEGSLPTGLYQVTLQGPDGLNDAKVQPLVLERRLPITSRTNTVRLPPSFAGRYSFEFMFQTDTKSPPIKVKREIVIDHGLETGHVDDVYSQGGKAADTHVTGLRLDANGVLRGVIRFSVRPPNDSQSYDEQFELSYADNHFVVVSGGWEMQPNEPGKAKELQKVLPPGYQPHLARPAPQTVTKN